MRPWGGGQEDRTNESSGQTSQRDSGVRDAQRKWGAAGGRFRGLRVRGCPSGEATGPQHLKQEWEFEGSRERELPSRQR